VPFFEARTEMPPAVNRKADRATLRDASSVARSDIRRIKPSAGESAEFREAIAYMKGVADAVARIASAPPEPSTSATSSRRPTLPYGGPPPSEFQDDGVEPGSGVRLKVAVPCPELYELAGLDKSRTE
jgi:hypothetical protein